MTAKAALNRQARGKFVKSFPPLVTMIAAWSWGEWLGYVTSKRPRRITTAPEIERPLDD
jgi:hypothetical protein